MESLKDALASAASVTALLDTTSPHQQPRFSTEDQTFSSSISSVVFTDASVAAIHVPPPSLSANAPSHSLVPAVASLSSVNFAVQAGSRLAVVGARGSGKTSLCFALLKLVPLASGDISFDGRSVQLFDTESISRLIAYVPSSPAVLAASVASNIAFSRVTASQAQVERAAVAVGADAWIRALPDSYNTIIGDGSGLLLTRSQMMQILFARALASDSSIVIVDDSLHVLDEGAEAAVLAALQLLHPRTLIVTSTAPSISQMCHHTVFLDRGTLVEQGSFAELTSRRCAFASYAAACRSSSQDSSSSAHSVSKRSSVDLLGALEQAVLGLRVDGRLSMSLLERVNEITEAAALEFLGS
jgi:ABC-type multidrug transport system fused ATPase/permease subunit